MTERHRLRRESAPGALVLMLLGVLLLGAGALVASGDEPRLVADDLGTVPAAAGPSATGPAGLTGGAVSRPVPAARALPVLAPPMTPGGASPDGAALPGAPSGTAAPGTAPPGTAAPGTAAPGTAGAPADPSAAPMAPGEPWTVSAIYPAPARPEQAAGAAEAAGPVLPAVLELPGRGVTAPVESVGTGPNGGMVIPEPVRTVGWWAPGVLPGGSTGSAVIAGHVDSATQGVGVLAVLPRLTAGEPVVVRAADGRTRTFRVAARREYTKRDLPREVFRRDGDPQLVLITCGGAFDAAAGSYESNIVVYAVPDPS